MELGLPPTEGAISQDPSLLENTSFSVGAHTLQQPNASLDNVTAQAASTGSALAADSQPFVSNVASLQEACRNEGKPAFEEAKPCDCGCVTQSVKAGKLPFNSV